MKYLIVIIAIFTFSRLEAQQYVLIKTSYAAPYGESKEGRDSLFIDIKSFSSKDKVVEFTGKFNCWLSDFGFISNKIVCKLDPPKKEAWTIGQENFDQATTDKILAIYQSTLKKKKK